MATQDDTTNATSVPTIHNTTESFQTFISINVSAQAPFKLTTINYVLWKLQFQTLFIGYDILGYINGTKPCPAATIITTSTTTLSPTYFAWIHQDELTLNTIIGSLAPTIIHFIA